MCAVDLAIHCERGVRECWICIGLRRNKAKRKFKRNLNFWFLSPEFAQPDLQQVFSKGWCAVRSLQFFTTGVSR